MQERQRFKPIDPLHNRLSEEAERLRTEARGTPPGVERDQAYSQGAACGNRLPHERVAQLKGSSASDIGRTAMDYRAYIMGPDGHIENRVELRCDDDVEAIRLAKQAVDGHDVELWQLDRHIETFRHSSERPILAVDHCGWRSLISDSA